MDGMNIKINQTLNTTELIGSTSIIQTIFINKPFTFGP